MSNPSPQSISEARKVALKFHNSDNLDLETELIAIALDARDAKARVEVREETIEECAKAAEDLVVMFPPKHDGELFSEYTGETTQKLIVKAIRSLKHTEVDKS